MEELKFLKVSYADVLVNCNCDDATNNSAKRIATRMLGGWFARSQVSAEEKKFAMEVLAKNIVYELFVKMIEACCESESLTYSNVLFDLWVPLDYTGNNSDDEYCLRVLDMSERALELNPTGCVICKSNFASLRNARLLSDRTLYNVFVEKMDEIFGFEHQQNGKRLEWAVYLV